MATPATPQRITRAMSHRSSPAPPSLGAATPTSASATAPGPPVSNRNTSLSHSQSHQQFPSNPYQVDFVIPFSIALTKGQDRQQAQREIKEGYEELLRALEGEGGLKVGSKGGRGGKGQEEVWVFVGASEQKIEELVAKENELDQSHNLPPHSQEYPTSPATRIRLIYNLLTSPALQNGLGITPGKGKWTRVKSIMALHDEEADKKWVEKWTVGGDWRVGLLKGLEESGAGTGLGHHQPPPVHLYFDFLSTYTLSLLPLSIISTLFYFFTPSDSYPPLYAFLLSIYATTFVAIWRIKERKLAVRWGTRGCESVAVGRLRPEYVANMGWDKEGNDTSAVDAVQAGNDLKRDAKVAISVPIIAACGVGLGVVLMGIFVLEAFVGQVYDGIGKEIVPLIPTALFSIVVPQIVALYHRLSKSMVAWEDHPTPVGAEKSLTAKTFAMNGIVAYLGLFLSAYIYVPFGSFIMAHVQQKMTNQDTVRVASTPEKAGLGPRTSGHEQKGIKAGRLKGQLFAYTVTNQVVNSFLELGLPYIMRFVNDWRAGKTTIKETIKRRGSDENEKAPTTEDEVEKRFLDKVERELALPEYSTFTDYAEMVTQFGYVTIWSIVWPIAPVFALINNYVEMRSDALKLCKHVRRPVGDRVETIGTWLDTLSIISWVGAVTNSTLIYLFRPSTTLHHQTPNPHVVSTTGSPALSHIVSDYYSSPTLQTLLPTLIPLGLVALAASHGFIILRWIVEGLAERILWRGSAEQVEIEKMKDSQDGRRNQKSKLEKKGREEYGQLRGGFWNGGEEGAREIGRAIKAE
ncbi:hypothetical protein CI109_107174 [Kwoniella shandongensis]|uniref:Uncharacterized protein n=1 Tax=Kwoniella shandongensis TaxID=1734106 RepID=A0A5M6C1W6_9TREE|nr:uncharacterized protein CI109_002457 [Kwoniella shandongensis]KAA5529116.1 hypothetical protein CI109_002457 [Kwoniella shandongensis]